MKLHLVSRVALEGAVANLKLEKEGISPPLGGYTFEVLPLIGRPLRHCPTSSTEVIGGLNIHQDGYEGRDVVAVATLDGTYIYANDVTMAGGHDMLNS